MDNIFAAKVGWLVGNMYSRVGTPDVEEKRADADQYKADFYEAALFSQTAWLSSAQLNELKLLVHDWRKNNPGAELSAQAAWDLLENVPSDPELIVDRAVSLLRDRRLIVDGADQMARNILVNDVYLKKLIARQR